MGRNGIIPPPQAALRVSTDTEIFLTTKASNRFPSSLPWVLLESFENAYLYGFALLQVFVTLFPLLTGKNPDTEFLPLMATSVYCAVGLIWSFIRLSTLYITQQY
jgi:alpha-1,3-glucosyltransferase